MAVVTATVLHPFAVIGNLRFRVVDITSNASNNDTYAASEFSQVLGAWIELDASGVTHGIALSGTGNTTLTFKLSGAAKGKLFIVGL